MSNPYSSAGGGTHFEARVVAYYLAAALAEAQARAMPGVGVRTVRAQRAALGEPLDDVIVDGIMDDGSPSKLSLQAKSSLTFTENDTEWVALLGQAWATFSAPTFDELRHRMGVAIATYHARADKYYVSVLNWAANSPSAADFLRRISLPDFSHKDQRTFVTTTRAILVRHAGTTISDDAFWRFLKAFRIVHFDFEALDASRDASGAVDRIRAILPEPDRVQAQPIWDHLIAAAGEIGPTGGGATRATLSARLINAGLPSGTGVTHWADIEKIKLETGRAKGDIKGDIQGLRLNRVGVYEEVENALAVARFVQIDGEPGSGKSALLKQFVEEAALAGPVILLKDLRIQAGGWGAHASQLGLTSDLVALLCELRSAGEPTLFVDGLDKVNDPAAQLTVNDIVRAIASSPLLAQWKILATVREQNLDHIATWLAPEALKTLLVRTVTVPELTREELDVVGQSFPRVAPLLQEAGGVDVLLRRPFFLEAVLRLSANATAGSPPATEVELLGLWWGSGGAPEQAQFASAQHRRNALLSLAERLVLAPNRYISIRDLPPEALEALRSAGVIRDGVVGHSVSFSHDIYEEWSLCQLLLGRLPDIAQELRKWHEPELLIRPVQLLGTHALETSATETEWRVLYENLAEPSLRPVWQRAVLVSCLRSTRTTSLLAKLADYLHRDNQDGLKKLLNTLKTLEVVPDQRFLSEKLLPNLEPDERVRYAQAHARPKPRTWVRFLDWYLAAGSQPQPSLIPDLLPVFATWQSEFSGTGVRHCDRIGALSHDWLVEFESVDHPSTFDDRRQPFGIDFGYREERNIEDEIRSLFLKSAADVVELCTAYLHAKARDRYRHMYRDKILAESGVLARTLPSALVDYIIDSMLTARQNGRAPFELDSILDGDDCVEGDNAFYPASPYKLPFLALLRLHESEGLRLIRSVCNHSVAAWRTSQERALPHHPSRTPLPVEIDFPWGKQQLWGDERVYLWFRGNWGNNATRCGLMALEFWALERIEAGDDLMDIARKSIELNESVAALGLGVSLCFASPKNSAELALPLITCPHVWLWDIPRMAHDKGMQANEIGNWQSHAYLLDPVRQLNRRPHRAFSIREAAPTFVLAPDSLVKEQYIAGIRSFANRLPFVFEDEHYDPEKVAALRSKMSPD